MSADREGIAELRGQIDDLRARAEERGLDVSEQIRQLEAQLDEAEEEAFARLSRFDRVRLARNQDRPFTLDFIQGLCTDFFELHGDRLFRDDPAIVGGIVCARVGICAIPQEWRQAVEPLPLQLD